MQVCKAIRWIDGCRARRTVELLAIIWVLAVCDLYFTLWAYAFTPLHEMNPWASTLLQHHRYASLALSKLLLTSISTAIFWFLRKRRITELTLWGLVFVYVGILCRWSSYTSNALELWTLCPAAASASPNELLSLPARPPHPVQLAQAHVVAMASAPHSVQAPRTSGPPAALFLENSPQNWPKPRT
jgi:hypothetical protein